MAEQNHSTHQDPTRAPDRDHGATVPKSGAVVEVWRITDAAAFLLLNNYIMPSAGVLSTSTLGNTRHSDGGTHSPSRALRKVSVPKTITSVNEINSQWGVSWEGFTRTLKSLTISTAPHPFYSFFRTKTITGGRGLGCALSGSSAPTLSPVMLEAQP